MAVQSLPQEIIDILNARLIDEYNAERFYIAASIWCDLNGFEYASKYFVDEYQDERKHAHKLQKHASDWNVKLSLPEVVADYDFDSLPSIIEQAYEMEYALFKAYNDDIKMIDDDYPSCELFLQKFIKIQDESVIGYADILKKLQGITDLFQLKVMEKKIFK